jgi:hypothetical protein
MQIFKLTFLFFILSCFLQERQSQANQLEKFLEKSQTVTFDEDVESYLSKVPKELCLLSSWYTEQPCDVMSFINSYTPEEFSSIVVKLDLLDFFDIAMSEAEVQCILDEDTWKEKGGTYTISPCDRLVEYIVLTSDSIDLLLDDEHHDVDGLLKPELQLGEQEALVQNRNRFDVKPKASDREYQFHVDNQADIEKKLDINLAQGEQLIREGKAIELLNFYISNFDKNLNQDDLLISFCALVSHFNETGDIDNLIKILMKPPQKGCPL